MKSNVTLIGMPSAGKSTIGVLLAKRLGYSFIDADILIQEKEGRLLKEIIAQEGMDGFLQVENRVNASIAVSYTHLDVYKRQGICSMEKQIRENAELFKLDGKPSLGLAFPQALQHVLAMLVGNITPPMLIASTLSLPPEDCLLYTSRCV